MGSAAELVVRRGLSRLDDEIQLAVDLGEQVSNPDAELVFVFASPRYDSDAIAEELAEVFAPVPVFGCTTAGEIGEGGFQQGSAVAMSIGAPGLRVGAGLSSNLTKSGFSCGRQATLGAIEALGLGALELDEKRHVAMVFVDGRRGQEELFIGGAAGSAPTIGFVGGSASDEMDKEPTARIFYDGRAHWDCGLILLFETDLPFLTIKSEHMLPTEERVVVTDTGPDARCIRELNGRPARMVYEEIIGIDRGDPIDPALAARFPFAYYVGGKPYVRSVLSVEEDSLHFACAVDNGAVLRSMRPGDLVGATRRDLDAANEALGGDIAALIAFNCLGRYLETEATGETAALGEVLCQYPVVGFNTLGEQINALHVNHTLAALAFGGGKDG